jgi:glycosyltransferase involved in cell wall biosynthesis
METPQPPIRVTIVQPALPKYRIPVFRELANRPGIKLRVAYGAMKGLDNVVAEGFDAVRVRRWERTIAGLPIMLDTAEWKYCSRRWSDVVLLRWSPRSILQLPALLRARVSGVPVVLWGHGYSKFERGWWRGVRNSFIKLAEALVFYEPRTRDAFLQAGYAPERLFVALNSIDHTEIEAARSWWQHRPDQLDQFRRRHDLDRGPVVLFVSRLTPANRVDLLVRATAELAHQFPNLRTVIIGSGFEEKERLQTLARQLQVDDNLVFQEGIYDERELAPWFLSADVFCYPANVGLSLIHAMWYGLPVVTSDNSAIQNPEIVALEPEVNGAVYQHENLRSLVDVLQKTISDEAGRESMSRAARQTVESRFTVKQMVDGMEQAIRFASKARSSNH